MLKRWMKTDDSWATRILSLTAGIVIFPHGTQKVLGWFGGGGFSATLEGMQQHFGLPAVIVVLVMTAEFLGGLGLIFGFLGRPAAFGVASVMVGAVFLGGHLQNGFFMNWTGQQAGEGFQFHLLMVGICLAVLLRGSGPASIDRALSRGR